MLVARPWLVLALVASLACTVADDEPAKAEPARPESTPPVLAPPELEPTPEPLPPTPSFDPETVTAVRARIVDIPNRKSWVACGIHHCVGALEVEVLDVGEPPPRMVLLVSCPADRRSSPVLEVGATIAFGLYSRKQQWSTIRGLPELPTRYVKSISAAP